MTRRSTVLLGLILLAGCNPPGFDMADLPPLQVPELEPVDVAPGEPVAPCEFQVELTGVNIPIDTGRLDWLEWVPGHHQFDLGSPADAAKRWQLRVVSSYEQQDATTGEVRQVLPEMRLVGAYGQWSLPNAGESPREGLSFEGPSVEFDVDLEAADGELSPVHAAGWMRCPDLSGPNETPPELFDLLHRATGAEVQPWSTYEFGRAKDHRGISARVRASGLDAAVGKIRQALPEGWTAFVGTRRFVDEPEAWEDSEIVVAPGGRMEDILRLAHVSPVNHDMVTEDVVAKFLEWDERYGVDVLRADVETVRFAVRDLPADELKSFAREIYEFSPDTVDQGFGSMNALVDELRRLHGVELWWD